MRSQGCVRSRRASCAKGVAGAATPSQNARMLTAASDAADPEVAPAAATAAVNATLAAAAVMSVPVASVRPHESTPLRKQRAEEEPRRTRDAQAVVAAAEMMTKHPRTPADAWATTPAATLAKLCDEAGGRQAGEAGIGGGRIGKQTIGWRSGQPSWGWTQHGLLPVNSTFTRLPVNT